MRLGEAEEGRGLVIVQRSAFNVQGSTFGTRSGKESLLESGSLLHQAIPGSTLGCLLLSTPTGTRIARGGTRLHEEITTTGPEQPQLSAHLALTHRSSFAAAAEDQKKGSFTAKVNINFAIVHLVVPWNVDLDLPGP